MTLINEVSKETIVIDDEQIANNAINSEEYKSKYK